MRRFLVLLALALVPQAAAAQKLTIHDIVELSRAGLGEEALLALIEVNRPVFPVDPETLKSLKDARVPPNVIVAIIKSGRTPPPQPLPVPEPLLPSAPAPPQVVVVEHEHYEEPRIREVAVPVPVYIPVRIRALGDDGHFPVRHPGSVVGPKPVEPVYWGWGGKLRPDAWKTAADVQKDARVPREPQKR